MPSLIAAIYHMSFLQAFVIGLIQGLTELFPISSLGHTVLIPSWIGGSWGTLVRQESSTDSPYLAFVVGLHIATALVLLGFYAKEWIRLIAGVFRSLVRRRIDNDTERLGWLIIIATIPVGILGLAFEHAFRTLFAKPVAAALFLTANGVILFAGERYRRRSRANPPLIDPDGYQQEGPNDERSAPIGSDAEMKLAHVGFASAFVIGLSQSLALLAGISREGVAMVGGLYRGLSHENAMRFSFLLSTPVILAAGALKLPDLFGTLGNGIRGQVLVGSAAAAGTSILAILFLSRYFKTGTLVPFAIYSFLFGFASVVRFGIF
jgi:undecaprenyl-diphosphatase